MTPEDRHAFATEALDLTGTERILELGCGHGVTATSICERLVAGGSYVGLDRSGRMTEAAARRTAEHVEAGRASFVTAAIAGAAFPPRSFDRVLGMHVPVFLRGDPAAELAALGPALAAEGALVLVWEPFDPADAPETGARQAGILARSGWSAEVRVADLGRTAATAVIARPPAV